MQKNFQKLFVAFKRIAFELVAGISLNYEENTCDQQWMC